MLGASSRSPAGPRHHPWVPPPGPVGQQGRLSETVVASAGVGRALTETVIAFAGAGRALTETAIAFAGVKWAFLVHFSGAEAMPVSEFPCWGRAVVLLVSTSPCCRASCAKKFALRRCAIVKARKSSPCALTMAQNWRFLACWASFFAPTAAVPVLDVARCTSGWLRWGFYGIRSLASTCRRRVGVLMMQFPLWGDAGQILELGCMLCAQQFRT